MGDNSGGVESSYERLVSIFKNFLEKVKGKALCNYEL